MILADLRAMQNVAVAAGEATDEARDPPDPREKPAAERHEPRPAEIGGRSGPDPTRFGDWEKNGRCIDF